jgi:branched-subunit amino acid aminotransferase/4-amino-4-deoxychorismate lyase
LWATRDYIRAAPGGTGAAKCGGNYAASLIAQAEATRNGCDQVVFLDAIERRWVEELGGMNIFFASTDGSLITPPLGGTILPASLATRSSASPATWGWRRASSLIHRSMARDAQRAASPKLSPAAPRRW